MTARVYAHRGRMGFRSRLSHGLEAFVLYWLLPAVLVIGYLWHATEATR